ncbi:MAG: hypothetical protein GXP10_06755 [Gammaproteobacteria bacterium]|nr:hypothetical protein [Gammaproteobacteria bacterium]
MQEPEFVTTASQVAHLLTQIQSKKKLLTATLAESSTKYSTALLEVNTDDGYLLLDELTPEAGHKKFLKTKKIVIKAISRGVHIHFSTHLVNVLDISGIAAYQVAFPEQLDYFQRRQYHRVKMQIYDPLPAHIHTVDRSIQLSGELVDLSLGGACIRFSDTAPPLIEVGDNFSCRFHLPNGEKISASITIRSTKAGKKNGQLEVGCRFIQLASSTQRAIGKSIMVRERELMKKSQTAKR